jgi:hypothetical protein
VYSENQLLRIYSLVGTNKELNLLWKKKKKKKKEMHERKETGREENKINVRQKNRNTVGPW